MKAWVRTAADSRDVTKVDQPVPEPGGHDVLVAVRAFGVGIHDRYFIPRNGPFPYVIGTEGSGIVTRRGAAVSTLDIGDRVMMTTALQPQGGTWAEFAVAPEHAVYRIPDSIDLATAAGLPIPGNTAIECLHTLDLAHGSTLFVGGGSGAIGTLLIQMATRRGIRTAASASPGNHDHLRTVGAALAVDYRDPAWPDQVRAWSPGGVDAALPIVPGIANECLAVVRDGGHVVTVSGDADSVEIERGIRVEQFAHRGVEIRPDVEKLLRDVAEGHIRVVLEQVYDFDNAVAGLEKTETRHARGKLVVTAPPSARSGG